MAHFKTAKAEIAYRRSELIKFAELGGDGKDVAFEQAFSNLAHAYLRDKAPSLQQYELGFQLLERNQDSTKAVGIFGFKIGSQLIYAPAFFLNGDLKGHELLYMKDQDQFIPLKENWINDILNKKPNVLGEPVDKNPSNLGISAPNLWNMNNPPTKAASAIRRDLLPGVAAFAHCATTNAFDHPKYTGVTDLETFLKKEGAVVIRALVSSLMHTPALAEKFASDFDGMGIIRRAVEATRSAASPPQGILPDSGPVLPGGGSVLPSNRTPVLPGGYPVTPAAPPVRPPSGPVLPGSGPVLPGSGPVLPGSGPVLPGSGPVLPAQKVAASASYVVGTEGKLKRKYVPKAHQTSGILEEVHYPQKTADLRVFTLDNFDPKSNVSAADREVLLRDGVLFLDKRAEDETAEVFLQSTLTLTNPTETGIYEILAKPGSFERCLVVFGPHTECGRQDFSTVVRLDGDKTWLNIHPSALWVRQKSTTNGEDFRKWLESQPAADSLSKSSTAVYMIVGPDGTASCPFRVDDDLSTDGDIKVYDVRFKDYATIDRPGNLPPLESREPRREYNGPYGERITLTGKEGGRLRAGGQDLYVPKGFKVVTIHADSDSEKEDGGIMCGCHGGSSSSSSPPPIVPGNNLDLQRAIYEKTAALKVYSSGTEVQINDVSMTPISGLVHLVREIGLREKAARSVLKEASAKRVARFLVKKANNPLMTGPGPSAPGIPDPSASGADGYFGASVPSMPSMEMRQKVDMPVADPSQASAMPAPDPQAANAVAQAAQTGQKEILDTAAIGSILKSVRDDTMIDRYLGDLMKGLDRLGRILFSFYWHGEEFQDRYGKQDMPELEDGLRNSFEQVGDLVLFLKQKTIEPFPDEMAHADLGHVAA